MVKVFFATLPTQVLLVCLLALTACSSKKSEAPVTDSAVATRVPAAKADSVSILAASQELYKAILDDTSAVIHYTFTDSAVFYADSACLVPAGKLARHTPLRLAPGVDRGYTLEQDVVPVILEGKKLYLKPASVGRGSTWQVDGRELFSIIAIPNREEANSAVWHLYDGKTLLVQRELFVSHGPLAVGPITQVQGKTLPQPLYALYSFSEECGLPQTADLFYFENGNLRFLKSISSVNEAGLFHSTSYQQVQGHSLVFLQHVHEVIQEDGESSTGRQVDSMYIAERTTYAWQGNRFVRIDSMAAGR